MRKFIPHRFPGEGARDDIVHLGFSLNYSEVKRRFGTLGRLWSIRCVYRFDIICLISRGGGEGLGIAIDLILALVLHLFVFLPQLLLSDGCHHESLLLLLDTGASVSGLHQLLELIQFVANHA